VHDRGAVTHALRDSDDGLRQLRERGLWKDRDVWQCPVCSHIGADLFAVTAIGLALALLLFVFV
jgi:hypothetical protein